MNDAAISLALSLFLAANAGPALASVDAEGEVVVKRVLENHRRRLAKLTSFDVKGRCLRSPAMNGCPDDRAFLAEAESSEKLERDGNRRRVEFFFVPAGGGTPLVTTSYWDGTRCWELSWGPGADWRTGGDWRPPAQRGISAAVYDYGTSYLLFPYYLVLLGDMLIEPHVAEGPWRVGLNQVPNGREPSAWIVAQLARPLIECRPGALTTLKLDGDVQFVVDSAHDDAVVERSWRNKLGETMRVTVKEFRDVAYGDKAVRLPWAGRLQIERAGKVLRTLDVTAEELSIYPTSGRDIRLRIREGTRIADAESGSHFRLIPEGTSQLDFAIDEAVAVVKASDSTGSTKYWWWGAGLIACCLFGAGLIIAFRRKGGAK